MHSKQGNGCQPSGLWALCALLPLPAIADMQDSLLSAAVDALHIRDADLAQVDDTIELSAVLVKAEPPPPPPYQGMEDGRRFSREEIAHSASSLSDPSRFLQTLPGVGRASDWQTTLMVRGGAPDQTVFMLDGVPLSRVNHYEGMRNEHGGSGIINMEYVDGLTFHRGPFPAHLPDRLSGVVDMRFRDGSRERSASKVSADVTGVGASQEGPLGSGGAPGSYAAVFRYSALDLLVRSGVVEAFGTPRYWNGQVRTSIPSGNSTFRLNAVGGSENWFNGIGNSAAMDLTGHAYSLGLDWDHRSGETWTRMAAYMQDKAQEVDFRTLEKERPRSPADSFSHFESGSERLYGATLDHSFPLGRNLVLRLGGSENLIQRDMYMATGDEATFLSKEDTVIIQTNSMRLGSQPVSEAAAYAEASLKTGNWEWYAGYRHFYEELSDGHGLGPRMAALYRPNRQHAFKAAYGLHTQPHEYADLERRGDDPRLPYMSQGALSWEWKPVAGLLLSLEGFAKEGYRISRSRLVHRGGSFKEAYFDTGRTSSKGFEVYMAKPRGGRFSYSAAYGYLHHRELDANRDWGRGAYSVPHSFNAAGEVALGYGNFLGFRYTTSSGSPYTPMDPKASAFLQTGVPMASRAWGETGKRFERVDVRLEMVRRIGTMRLTAYGEIENILDRRNAFGERWNPVEGTSMPVEGMGRLPVAGLALGF